MIPALTVFLCPLLHIAEMKATILSCPESNYPEHRIFNPLKLKHGLKLNKNHMSLSRSKTKFAVVNFTVSDHPPKSASLLLEYLLLL